jgi:hypothetical protein
MVSADVVRPTEAADVVRLVVPIAELLRLTVTSRLLSACWKLAVLLATTASGTEGHLVARAAAVRAANAPDGLERVGCSAVDQWGELVRNGRADCTSGRDNCIHPPADVSTPDDIKPRGVDIYHKLDLRSANVR